MNKSIFRLTAIFFIIGFVFFVFSKSVFAAEDWKTEFDDICSQTNDSMALTKEELKALIERCDKLKPSIEKLDESAKKVYLKRLQMCRDMLAFALESKEQTEK